MQRMPWAGQPGDESPGSTSRQATARPWAAMQNSTSRCRKCSSKGCDPHLPALGAEPAGELLGAGLVGAAAAGADQGEAGAEDVDVAALQRAGRRLPPETIAPGPPCQSISAAYSPRRCGRSSWQSTGPRWVTTDAVPRIGHVGQVRLGRQVVDAGPALLQRLDQLAVLGLQALQVGLAAAGERAAGDGVGRQPAIVVGRADQHIGKAAGLRGDGPARGFGGHPVKVAPRAGGVQGYGGALRRGR